MAQPRLKDSTIIRMIDESKRIQRSIIFWLAVLAVAIFAVINPTTFDNTPLFVASSVAIIIAIASIVLSALRVRGLDNNTPPPAVVIEDVDDASDGLLFDSEQTPTDARLVAVAGKTIYLSAHQPDSGTWGDLANALYDHGWAWSREGALRNSDCFKNLTTVYPDLTKDMLRMRIIKGRRNNYRVSLKGQMVLVAESPDLFLEHVTG